MEDNGNAIYQLFLKRLHPQLQENGFQVLEGTQIEISAHRCKVVYEKKRTNAYGEIVSSQVDVIGMPMGSVLIVLYAIVHGSDGVDVKMKIKSSENEDDVRQRFEKDFIFRLVECLAPKLTDLPNEIKTRILSNLRLKDIVNLTLADKKWHELCTDDGTWKRLFKRDYPKQTAKPDEGESWQRLYKKTTLKVRQEKQDRESRERWSIRGLLPPPTLPMLEGIPHLAPAAPPLGPNIFADPFPDPFAPMFPPFPRHPGNRHGQPFGPFGGGFFGGF